MKSLVDTINETRIDPNGHGTIEWKKWPQEKPAYDGLILVYWGKELDNAGIMHYHVRAAEYINGHIQKPDDYERYGRHWGKPKMWAHINTPDNDPYCEYDDL